jgi:hypothetical protein
MEPRGLHGSAQCRWRGRLSRRRGWLRMRING